MQDRDQLGAAGVIERNEVERFDEAHRVPAHRASPHRRRASRLRICPLLRAAVVVAVDHQARFFIAGVLLHHHELGDGFVEISVLREKRRRHVQPVEPHLMWVTLLVPEASVGIAWLLA